MAKRELRSGGSTSSQSLDTTKIYKLSSAGAVVESTGTPAGTDILFSGSRSSLRRLTDLERNVSILAARTQTEDGSADGSGSGTVEKANRWTSSRTITLAGDLTGNASIRGDADVTLTATVAANSVALGTDTTGNYMSGVTAGTGISVSHTAGEGSTATITSTITQYTDALARAAVSAGTGISYNSSTGVITNSITQYTDALARAAVSFTAGSGAYNSTTGVFTIPTNTNQLTNGAGYVTSSGVTAVTATGPVVSSGGTTPVISMAAATASVDGYMTSTFASKLNGIAAGATNVTNTNQLTNGNGFYSSGSTPSFGATSTGALTVTGGITATGEITAYYSDANLKKNVVEITDPIAKIMSIRGVTFRPNETALALGVTDKEEVGVIAQEVEAVLPQLVTPSAFKGYKTVKYDKLTALLVEAVKAQQLQIDALRAEIAKLGGSATTEL